MRKSIKVNMCCSRSKMLRRSCRPDICFPGHFQLQGVVNEVHSNSQNLYLNFEENGHVTLICYCYIFENRSAIHFGIVRNTLRDLTLTSILSHETSSFFLYHRYQISRFRLSCQQYGIYKDNKSHVCEEPPFYEFAW